MMKKILSLIMAFAFVLTISSASLAAPGNGNGAGNGKGAGNSPMNLLSTLTGKTLTELLKEREAGKTAYQIAEDNGKGDEFQREKLNAQKERIDARVKDGRITQEDADKVYNKLQENQANCDGTRSQQRIMKEALELGQGQGSGMKNGQGQGTGTRSGQRQRGSGTRTGVRQYNCVK